MGFTIYGVIEILPILMSQNINFKDQKRLFVKSMRKDSNRGPQNRQKYILPQKIVVVGKNLPCGIVCMGGIKKI